MGSLNKVLIKLLVLTNIFFYESIISASSRIFMTNLYAGTQSFGDIFFAEIPLCLVKIG